MRMATSTRVSLEEYLNTHYEPSCELIDGELRPKESGATVLIPDIVLSRHGQQSEEHDVLHTPPLLCVEVISPSQSFGELYDKCRRYLRWGVPYCWILDAVTRTAWQIGADEMPREIARGGSLRAGEIEIKLADLFKPTE